MGPFLLGPADHLLLERESPSDRQLAVAQDLHLTHAVLAVIAQLGAPGHVVLSNRPPRVDCASRSNALRYLPTQNREKMWPSPGALSVPLRLVLPAVIAASLGFPAALSPFLRNCLTPTGGGWLGRRLRGWLRDAGWLRCRTPTGGLPEWSWGTRLLGHQMRPRTTPIAPECVPRYGCVCVWTVPNSTHETAAVVSACFRTVALITASLRLTASTAFDQDLLVRTCA